MSLETDACRAHAQLENQLVLGRALPSTLRLPVLSQCLNQPPRIVQRAIYSWLAEAIIPSGRELT